MVFQKHQSTGHQKIVEEDASQNKSCHQRCSLKKVFFSGFYKILRNTFFTEHLRTAASDKTNFD